jgi:phosphatidylglycerophosphatase A
VAERIPRPNLSGAADYIATVGGIGLLPIMPGSWWSVGKIQAKWGHDPSVVVVDEAAGMSLVFLAPAAHDGLALWACAVFLFRVFDVAKPWPMSYVNDRTEAWAVIGDDILAGIATFIAVQLVSRALLALGIILPSML